MAVFASVCALHPPYAYLGDRKLFGEQQASSSVTGNRRRRELGVVRVPPSDSAKDAPLRDDMLGQRIIDGGMRLRWRNTELRRFDGAVPMVDANTIVCDARALVLLHDAGALAAGERHAADVRADG